MEDSKVMTHATFSVSLQVISIGSVLAQPSIGTFFFYAPYAHTGHGVGLLGSADGFDSLPGTLTPAKPLQTVAGEKYTIAFFHASAFSGFEREASAFVEILWNRDIV